MIRLTVYIRYPLSLRHVEDILFERGIEICRDGEVLMEPVRPDVRSRDPKALRSKPSIFALRWHMNEVFVGINGKPCDF